MFCLLRSSWKFHEFANLDVSIYLSIYIYNYIHFYSNSYFIELPRPVFSMSLAASGHVVVAAGVLPLAADAALTVTA